MRLQALHQDEQFGPLFDHLLHFAGVFRGAPDGAGSAFLIHLFFENKNKVLGASASVSVPGVPGRVPGDV